MSLASVSTSCWRSSEYKMSYHCKSNCSKAAYSKRSWAINKLGRRCFQKWVHFDCWKVIVTIILECDIVRADELIFIGPWSTCCVHDLIPWVVLDDGVGLGCAIIRVIALKTVWLVRGRDSNTLAPGGMWSHSRIKPAFVRLIEHESPRICVIQIWDVLWWCIGLERRVRDSKLAFCYILCLYNYLWCHQHRGH